MNRARIVIMSVIAIAFLLGLAALLRRSEPMTSAQLEAVINFCAKSGRLARYDLPTFDVAGERVDALYLKACAHLARTKYAKQVHGLAINPNSIDPSLINLVFFGDGADDLFRDFRGNCAYTGYKNIIVCDLRFLHQMTGVAEKNQNTKAIQGPQGELQKYAMASRASTALWVLGHEIGHLALGHKSRHFLFRDEPSDRLILNPDGRPKGADFLAEQEADAFAFEVFKESEIGRFLGNFLRLGLSQVIVDLANGQLRKQGEPPDTVMGIEKRIYTLHIESKTHPPIFLRAVAMAQRLAEGLDLETTNHFRHILEHIEVR